MKRLAALALAIVACQTGSGGSDGSTLRETGAGCVIGTLECACAPHAGCAVDDDGETLQCVAGVCLHPACRPGSVGCGCAAGDRCGADLHCASGACVRDDCEAGSEGCGCAGGSCDPSLHCRDGVVCVDAAGYEGGACFANGTCHPGQRCDHTQGLCVFCERGSAGCHCTDSGTCTEGLTCAAGVCTAAASLPPENPVCYTPCRADLPDGVDVRACDSDGLIEGCVDGRSCERGSCVAPGESPVDCSGDIDCPIFQTCLAGGCYSNCTNSLECPAGLGCYRRVCRVPCMLATGTSACPSGSACDSRDGETGYCVPVLPPDPTAPAPETAPTFEIVATGATDLSNLRQTTLLEFHYDGATPQRITVRKWAHSLRTSDGALEQIELPRIDPTTGAELPCAGSEPTCPLWWLELGEGATRSRSGTVDVVLPAHCADACPSVTIGNAGGGPDGNWSGRLTVTGPGGTQEVALGYAEQVAGRWEGQAHYFAAFQDDGLEEWLARSDRGDVSGVANGLIQRWGAFRRGNLEGWDEMQAVLTATRTASWDQPRTRELCRGVTGGSSTAVCYPYVNRAGVRVYVENALAEPIPSATTELPIAFHLRPDISDPTALVGRIDSSTALQYPGNPAVALRLGADPSRGSACDPAIHGDCVVFMRQLRADVTVGGRYVSADGSCASGYQAFTVPWLVPGIVDRARGGAGAMTLTECREASVPLFGDDVARLNVDLAAANPAPDGLARTRSLELLDGALVNQRELVLLVRERMQGFLGDDVPLAAYAFLYLRRTPTDLEDDDYDGAAAPSVTRRPPSIAPTCSADLLARMPAAVRTDPSRLATTLIDGMASEGAAFGLTEITDVPNRIHYLCDGHFDGGGDAEVLDVDPFDGGLPISDGGTYFRPDGGGGRIYVHVPTACLPGSAVTFFYTAAGVVSQASVIQHPCQTDGSCAATLESWRGLGWVWEENPVWRCTDPARAVCTDDPHDLRQGKRFYERPAGAIADAPVESLAALIESAFRYKTRFQSSLDVGEVGFAPQICGPGIEYCYDPDELARAEERVDCLLDIYAHQSASLTPTARDHVERFLRDDFSEGASGEGFERLYAELLIMLGDEELTNAFASRFDAAGLSSSSFEGDRFEIDGLGLTGVAGSEMRSLYAAAQYYQIALDRLYRHGEAISIALSRGDTTSQRNFISPATVTLYLGRLIRASTQKATVWSEIARRYRDFDRPEIARRVLERSYAQVYLESVLVSRLMLDIADQSGPSYRAQIEREVDTAQRSFRIAMLDMRDVFEEIIRNATFFGFPAEYVPFPAVDTSTTTSGTNGFESLLITARQRMEIARAREDTAFTALSSSHVDAAQFQAELIRVRNTYEDQLATMCGTFVGSDGVRYPAIRRYAEHSDAAMLAGDPCGLVSNGTIYEQMLEVDAARASLDAVLVRYRNARADITDETNRVSLQCGLILEAADFEYQSGSEVRTLEHDLAVSQLAANGAARLLGAVGEGIGQYANCVAGDILTAPECAGLATLSAGFGIASVVLEGVAQGLAIGYQDRISQRRLDTAHWNAARPCDAMLIDSAPRVVGMVRGLDEITLEALRAQIQLEQQIAEVTRATQEAQRLEEREHEAQQQLINVEAARNDPNVRIYRNDAVINADIAFDDAMRAAYRATRMYEYYTSTSYARLDELFVIRLASRGRPNLEAYLVDLENAFDSFEEELGLPDARVAILSLRDDILQIPYLDDSGRPLTPDDRSRMMRERLDDPSLLDRNGYITIPFGTTTDSLSPLTRNHKIRYLEANLIGGSTGDRLGRVYVRQRGTSVVRSVRDETQYYVFPERTAVINLFFNGNRVFPPEVYQNIRLRDRPYANTLWELVINRRDEMVNDDIDFSSLTDLQLFVHYTDFTAL